MAITMEQIKELRDATGVSIMACKKALEEAGGDFEAAVDLLRKKGQAKAADRAGRDTGEGAVYVKEDGGKMALVALKCETDFVARGDDFEALLDQVATEVLEGKIAEGATESETVKDAVLKLGENVQLHGVSVLSGATVGSYIHSNKKIGVGIALEGGSVELAKDVAMHAAATNPKVVSPEEVSDELVAKEKEIWKEQLAAEGKPAEIMEKIMMGKEKKFREDSALLKQPFVKNPDLTIEQLLSQGGATLTKYVRFSV